MDGNDPNDMPESLGYGNFGSQQEVAEEPTTQQGDELDELASDMDQSSNDDPLDRDLGYGGEDDEEEDADTSQQEGDEETQEDSEEDPEADEQEDDSEDEDIEEEAEVDEEAEDSEEEEDELLYDAERDFPDSDVQPTKYRDRVALNSGFTEKVRYLRDKKGKIEELGGRFGAIPLPEYFGDNEDMIDQVVDRDAFASLSDEEAKQAIHDMDVAIKRATSKADRLESEYERKQQSQRASKEYDQAVDELADALGVFDISPNDAASMQVQDIISKADEAIAELEDKENSREFIERHDAKTWREELERLENAKQTIREFPEKAERIQNKMESEGSSGQEFDPELTKSTYEGFKSDRPDHSVFEGNTAAREEDFLEYVRGKIERKEIMPPQHEREWAKQADQYVDMIEKEKQRYEQRKNKTSKSSSGSSKKKTADDSPVTKEDKKPNPRDIADGRSRRNVTTTRDIDDDLERLAREMN